MVIAFRCQIHFHLHVIRGHDRSHRGTRRTGKRNLLEATRRRKGTVDGAGGTLAAPGPEVRRTTPIHGKIPGQKTQIWKLQKILSSRKGSVSQTCKKNTQANTKVYDFNQKTMQALSGLALVYARFEEAGADVEVETSEGDLLYADMRTALEGLADVQQEQERLKVEQKNTRDSLRTASIELNNRRVRHDAACRGLEDVGKKTTEVKREADDAYDRIRSTTEITLVDRQG